MLISIYSSNCIFYYFLNINICSLMFLVCQRTLVVWNMYHKFLSWLGCSVPFRQTEGPIVWWTNSKRTAAKSCFILTRSHVYSNWGKVWRQSEINIYSLGLWCRGPGAPWIYPGLLSQNCPWCWKPSGALSGCWYHTVLSVIHRI